MLDDEQTGQMKYSSRIKPSGTVPASAPGQSTPQVRMTGAVQADPQPVKTKHSVWSIQYVANGKRFHAGQSINIVATGLEEAVTKFRLAHPDGENSTITSVNKGPTIDMGISEVDKE